MKSLMFALCGAFALGNLAAQKGGWEPSPGHTQTPIWPVAAPNPQPVRDPEIVEPSGNTFLVAGREVISVSNVTRPTMTVYSPKGKNTGIAVIVFPGGGYRALAIDLEGTEVCDWLTSEGVTCVLLKYRVTDVGPYPKSGPYPESPMALEDAQRTMGLVRLRASEWHIDPHKIGVLGFSAGGHLVAAISNHFERRFYPAIDAADNESCRPDFAVAIYPGHLSLHAAEWDAKQGTKKFLIPHLEHQSISDAYLALNPDLRLTHRTPPTFLLQAEDDHVDSVYDSLAYFIALQKAGVSAEMHLYPYGGHAFGLRQTKLAITEWPQLVARWLKTIGIIPN
ncbi:MAG: alpha/beta hydrolase [Acidobacteriota bacterium]|nr:alpha/beta hydrolase [Acidobacteriota bacterium]